MIQASSPLTIQHLKKKFGAFTAVDDLSLTLDSGEIFGLLGPNGAGKTTAISMIMTLIEPTDGQIEVFGHDVKKNPEKAKHMCGFVPQETVHHGFFNVQEILRFHAEYYGLKPDPEYSHYLLNKLDLYSHRLKKVNQLSGGMKRRLMIAKALIHHPRLLLLDEPTAGVDVELRHTLWDFIQELRKQDMTILLTTHYIEEAERLCNRIGFLKQGQLFLVDQVSHLLEKHASKRIRLTLDESPSHFSHPLLEAVNERTLLFRVPTTMNIQELLRDLSFSYSSIVDIHVERGTLEEVMQDMLKKEKK